ncbi:MAG: GGDEF and EAL domain-containing protein [Fibrobacter sp.]|jgi:diguanylate cyclase (GGDEF)-like protein|nr:GGDEF and EAL domain-containing protein [Fibrobacter sp.]
MIIRPYKILRFCAVVVVSILVAVFVPDFLGLSINAVFWACYWVFAVLMAALALFGRFRFRKYRAHKMLNDFEVPVPELSVTAFDHQKEAREKESLLQSFFNVSAEAYWDFNPSIGKVFWSDRAVQIVGVEGGIGDSFASLLSNMFESDRDVFRNTISEALEQKKGFSLEVRLHNAIQGMRSLLINGNPQLNAEGHLVRMIGTLLDISVHKTTQRDLVYSIYHDSLTGLKNRRFFLEHLDEEVIRATNRPDYLFALIFVDIDRFNGINDSFGHDFANNVLREVGDRLVRFCSDDSLVARIDGDEFGIILKDLDGIKLNENLKSMVYNLQSRLKHEIDIDGRKVLLNVSMAVVINSGFKDVEDLVACADTTLKQAKKNGSGTVQFFSSGIRQKAMELYRLEIELRKAILYQEFILVYQPIVNIRTRKVSGFEALVRWNSAERGFIPPSDFIPMAEETGLIVSMGEQILRMACATAKAWVDAGHKDLWVAVNFSAKQFAQDNVKDEVSRVLAETRLPPKNLKLEITEYTAMKDSEKIEDVMKDLSKMGVQISIDDFGTGYSSLIYLKRYPIRTLKIDKSFIKGVPTDPDNTTIAKMVILMGKTLNLELIAEGVETREQLDFLRAEGCDLIQGFYYSKPLFSHDAMRLIERYANKSVPYHVEGALLSKV